MTFKPMVATKTITQNQRTHTLKGNAHAGNFRNEKLARNVSSKKRIHFNQYGKKQRMKTGKKLHQIKRIYEITSERIACKKHKDNTEKSMLVFFITICWRFCPFSVFGYTRWK